MSGRQRREGVDDRLAAGKARRGRVFTPSFYVFAALAAASGALSFHLGGKAAVVEALAGDVDLLVYLLPRMGPAVLIAGFVQVLVPKDAVAAWVGEKSGLKGMVIASVAGMLTPGGPVTAFSLVVALHASGADRGALVAYVTAWSLLGMQRLLVWEIPLMGGEFALLRFAVSALLPVVAGLIARQIPLAIGRAPS